MAKETKAPKRTPVTAATPETPAATAAAGPSSMAAVLGEVVSLMVSPSSHKHLFLADLEWLVMPPLMLRQFRLWRRDDRPVGFAAWAFLSEEVEARVMTGVRRLKPAEWNSGDRPWLIDLLAPGPEVAKAMIDELKRVVFPGRPLKGLQPAEGGGTTVGEL